MEEKKPCIAMVPSAALSHLIPLVEFAKLLVLHHPHFHVSLLIATLGPPSSSTRSILHSLPPHISFTFLPEVNLHDLPHHALDPAAQLGLTITLSLPSLRHALTSLASETHLVALVATAFALEALEVGKQFNLPSYAFFSSAATSLSFCLQVPKLHDDGIDYKTLTQPLKLPGCSVAFEVGDLPDIFLDKLTEAYKSILKMCKGFYSVDGIIVNSFIDLEPEAIRALQENEHNNKFPPIYPVGPIVQNESSIINGSECLTWLDNQPRNSVLYVSFGSGGTLSVEQLNELAFGLELSGHRFLWVVRAPSDSANAAYLNAQKEDPLEHLPKGFANRTKGRGLVVPSWAPQIEVLRHESTGGFLSHCGWSSTLESVVHGVPMIVWPLFAEQRMNAVMLTEVFKIAVRPKESRNNSKIIEKEEVARVVKSVMEGDEGKEIKKRIELLKDAATKTFSEDGSSTRTLSNLALQWKNLSGM